MMKRTIVLAVTALLAGIVIVAIEALSVCTVGALIGVLGYSQVARMIVGGWIVLNTALWGVAVLWLWRVRVLQRRALRVSFPRAQVRARCVR